MQSPHNPGNELVSRKLVHLHDAPPACRHLWQHQRLGEVHQAEHILLEAAAAESNPHAEELAANARVGADSASDLVNVGAGHVADGGNRVDAADTLGEHRVGRELGEFRAEDVGGEDAGARDPAGVY
jgi:hypothetical protein